jgi:hypothetical protein
MNLGLKWLTNEIGTKTKFELLENDPLLLMGCMKTPAVFMFGLGSNHSPETKKQNNELFRHHPSERKSLVTYTEGAQSTTSVSVLKEGFQSLQRLLSGEDAATQLSRSGFFGGVLQSPRNLNSVCVIDHFD